MIYCSELILEDCPKAKFINNINGITISVLMPY